MPTSVIQEPFTILYNGVSVQVNPVINGLDMQYQVSLPTGAVMLETAFDEDELFYWIEVPGGRTTVANEIGELIERRDA